MRFIIGNKVKKIYITKAPINIGIKTYMTELKPIK